MAATERTSGRAALACVRRELISLNQRGEESKKGRRLGRGTPLLRTFSAVELALSSADPFLGKQNRARVLPARIRVNDLCSECRSESELGVVHVKKGWEEKRAEWRAGGLTELTRKANE